MRLWVRAALAFAVLFFVLGLSEDFEDPKAAAARVCGLALIATAAAAWRTAGRLVWTPLDRAVLAWLAIELLATLFSSAPALSLFGDSFQREGFATSLAMGGLYLGARIGTRDGADLERTLDVGLLAITLASTYALFQAAGLDWIAWAPRIVGGAPSAVGRPAATLGHATVLGVASSAAAAAAVGRAFAPGRWRVGWALAAALCVGATLVTLARAAWLGLAAGVAVAVVLLLAARPRRISWRAVFVAAGLLAAIAVLVSASGWGGRLAARFGELLHPGRGSGASRIEIWRTALDAWRARPWWGWGPDTFGMVFSHYQTAALWRNEWGFVPFHAHSVYLQTLATRGVAGCASAAFWVVALLATARAAWRGAPEDRDRVATLLGMLTALAVAGAFGALGIAGQSLLVVASGLLAARAAPPAPQPPPRAAVWAGVLVAGLAALWAAADLSASAAAAEAQAWLDRADTSSPRESWIARERARATARRAARLAPADDRIACLSADASFALADLSPQPVPLMLEATQEARRAVRLVPERAKNQLRLGRVLSARVAMGDRASLAEARATLDRAARLAPADALVLGECARMDLVIGDVERALDVSRQATQLYPDDGPSQAMLGRALVESGERRAGAAALRRAVAGSWHGDLAGREDAARESRLHGD